MSKWTLSAGALSVLASLACGGLGGGGAANKAACEAWITKQNNLPCMKMGQVPVESACAGVDLVTVDQTAFYKCMEDGTACNGDIYDPSGTTECAALQGF